MVQTGPWRSPSETALLWAGRLRTCRPFAAGGSIQTQSESLPSFCSAISKQHRRVTGTLVCSSEFNGGTRAGSRMRQGID